MSDENRTWSAELSPGAVRGLGKLPHKVAAAMAEFVTAVLPTDPYRMSKPLRFALDGWRVARRGDYRVTFHAVDDRHVLYVGRVEHRAHLYRLQKIVTVTEGGGMSAEGSGLLANSMEAITRASDELDAARAYVGLDIAPRTPAASTARTSIVGDIAKARRRIGTIRRGLADAVRSHLI